MVQASGRYKACGSGAMEKPGGMASWAHPDTIAIFSPSPPTELGERGGVRWHVKINYFS
jgi:hypothetical protein